MKFPDAMISETDLDVLARTIYGEARGEPREGKVAVGIVIINRWRSGMWFAGKTVAETCQKPWQFSCWNGNDPNRAKLLTIDRAKPSYLTCFDAAVTAIDKWWTHQIPDDLLGCTHYQVEGTGAKWSVGKTPAVKIGRHLFYRGIA
jgi:N-acetylmuramoyl-L-alanine amidase